MRCVAYIRVSTKEQDEHVQEQAIRQFAQSRNIDVVKFYIDKGESGSKVFRERPQASLLLSELGAVRPECVLSWALDRLGRSMLDTMNTVLELEGMGVRVITIKEEFLQTLDPNIRKLILSILAWVAEYERRRIRERQEEAWRQGKQKGRPPKVTDNVIIQYIRKYGTLPKKAIWKIMRQDGYDISYERFLERVKGLATIRYDLKHSPK